MMKFLKNYWRKAFRILTPITVIITLLVFTTGKSQLADYIDMINSWFNTSSPHSAGNSSTSVSIQQQIPNSDNLLTTIFKTFFVIIAIVFFVMASIVSILLEFIIWIISWGDNKFYITKQIWNLCWNKMVSNWYWAPSSSTYLWITFLFYSGFFGTSYKKPKTVTEPLINRKQSRKS